MWIYMYICMTYNTVCSLRGRGILGGGAVCVYKAGDGEAITCTCSWWCVRL